MSKPTQKSPTVYFDGGCPVCSREIAMYQRQPGADGVRWVDVAHCEASELGAGLSRPAAMARLHLRDADGHLVSGAAAFTTLWRSLPRWAWHGRHAVAAGSRLPDVSGGAPPVAQGVMHRMFHAHTGTASPR